MDAHVVWRAGASYRHTAAVVVEVGERGGWLQPVFGRWHGGKAVRAGLGVGLDALASGGAKGRAVGGRRGWLVAE